MGSFENRNASAGLGACVTEAQKIAICSDGEFLSEMTI